MAKSKESTQAYILASTPYTLHQTGAIKVPLNSPVRLIPAVGVTTTAPQNATSIFGDPAGAHYRTLSMFFMFQKKTKKGGCPP